MKYPLLLILAFCYACQPPVQPPVQTVQTVRTITSLAPSTTANTRPQDSIPCPGKMLENALDTIPTDLYSPKIRGNVCGWWMPKDTITPNGNFVRYLISKDSCCLDYLFLEWGNKHFRNIENLGSLRQFHPRMNPEFIGESKQFIMMEAAASGGVPVDGWRLWLFPLSKDAHFEVYDAICSEAIDFKSLTILRSTDDNNSDNPGLELYNILTKRSKPIKLKNRILHDPPAGAIDSVSITPRKFFLRIETYDKNDKIGFETISFANDLK